MSDEVHIAMAGKRHRCLAVGADLAALRRGTKRRQVVHQARMGTFGVTNRLRGDGFAARGHCFQIRKRLLDG